MVFFLSCFNHQVLEEDSKIAVSKVKLHIKMSKTGSNQTRFKKTGTWYLAQVYNIFMKITFLIKYGARRPCFGVSPSETLNLNTNLKNKGYIISYMVRY